MNKEDFPLQEKSVRDLFCGGEHVDYNIPIYQRNYAWGKDEITALVQDVYDACCSNEANYHIGTLVTYRRGEHTYEVIDGQQRLTTILLVLIALRDNVNGSLDAINIGSKLTYRARRKSSETLDRLAEKGRAGLNGGFDEEQSILNGLGFAEEAIAAVVQKGTTDCISQSNVKSIKDYVEYFMDHVHIIFYQVPRDIDLNQYFEIMNSRGEQLEQHEVVKARLLDMLSEEKARSLFASIWDGCSEMNAYVQSAFSWKGKDRVFGNECNDFTVKSFNGVLSVSDDDGKYEGGRESLLSALEQPDNGRQQKDEDKEKSHFKAIIDFPNFLLIVLKLTRLTQRKFAFETETDFINYVLDDKQLLKEFENTYADKSEDEKDEFARIFAFNLLQFKFFLDNYVVHHENKDEEEEEYGKNPWELCKWERKEGKTRAFQSNTFGESTEQDKCVQLLSMFEVSYTARTRKNYLLYCLLYLHSYFADHGKVDGEEYRVFLSNLARSYLYNVYLGDDSKVNTHNNPVPGSFDAAILESVDAGKALQQNILKGVIESSDAIRSRAQERFGNGEKASDGIPLYVFNYLEYLLWEAYYDKLRGKESRKDDSNRRAFFGQLGCEEFEDELNVFDNFSFSRTRRSLEHFYAQARQRKAEEEDEEVRLSVAQINCLGNYAMIGAGANSSGSNWDPKQKLDHYLDSSGKITQVSVASIKLRIMMQICKKNAEANKSTEGCWTYKEIEEHQKRMIDVLFGGLAPSKEDCDLEIRS